jgi:hypothetical protein
MATKKKKKTSHSKDFFTIKGQGIVHGILSLLRYFVANFNNDGFPIGSIGVPWVLQNSPINGALAKAQAPLA